MKLSLEDLACSEIGRTAKQDCPVGLDPGSFKPEKKSYPPRSVIVAGLLVVFCGIGFVILLIRAQLILCPETLRVRRLLFFLAHDRPYYAVHHRSFLLLFSC